MVDILYKITVETEVNKIYLQKRMCTLLLQAASVGWWYQILSQV